MSVIIASRFTEEVTPLPAPAAPAQPVTPPAAPKAHQGLGALADVLVEDKDAPAKKRGRPKKGEDA